jgi:hypothetical protein
MCRCILYQTRLFLLHAQECRKMKSGTNQARARHALVAQATNHVVTTRLDPINGNQYLESVSRFILRLLFNPS